MRISSIRLQNFKRFTDLTIDQLPENAKLVLLIGSNGSGKSSVFDAFEAANTLMKRENFNSSYYDKNGTNSPLGTITFYGKNKTIKWDDMASSLSFHNPQLFYGRTSFRHVPRLTKANNTTANVEEDNDRPRFFIDKDNRFENDIEKITQQILREVFRERISAEQIRANYVEPINNAFERIFGNASGNKLSLIDIIPPLDGNIAQINFQKGESEIHYNFLSAGEKEVVNILFNLLVRREQYVDTIYFLDEIDLHLNTKLQYNLIKEITENWIPKNCQLWTASHSLGFIEYANDTDTAVIIDLDDLDFDKPQKLSPSSKRNYQVFELAVSREFVEKIFSGRTIVFSENSDTPLYNDLSLPDTIFFNAIDKLDVFYKSKNLGTSGLIDRDFLTDEEISALATVYPNIRILPYYSIENLLYHPSNLCEYYAAKNEYFDQAAYFAEIRKEKDTERDYVVAGIAKARDGYPFYKENEHAKLLKSFKENSRAVIDLLRSNDFETFYKVYPAKDYGKTIAARQNINRKALAKTKWFRQQIEALFQQSLPA